VCAFLIRRVVIRPNWRKFWSSQRRCGSKPRLKYSGCSCEKSWGIVCLRSACPRYVWLNYIKTSRLVFIVFHGLPQLIQHIPRESLPRHLGGTVDVEHDKWLSYCLNYMTNSDKYGSSAMSDHICNSNSAKRDTGPETKVCIL